MAKLNQKQLKLLREMSARQLVGIICVLVEDNKLAKSQLISNYLASPHDILKTVASEYKRKIKANCFYDDFRADDFFSELNINIVFPLERIVSAIPEKTERFCQELLLTFHKLCGVADASDKNWTEYYDGVVNVWVKSLILQKDKGCDVISDKIMTILNEDSYFNFDMFDVHKKDLGYDVIRSLRQRLSLQHNINAAIELSFYIKDIDFIRQCFNEGRLTLPEYVIKFAELLIDEMCSAEAILVLNSIQNNKPMTHPLLRDKWTEVFVLALIEEGETQQARAYCIEGFKRDCNSVFYNIYNKIDQSSESKEVFFNIAKEKGVSFTIRFLSDITDYERIDSEICHAEKDKLSDMLNVFYASFFRSLSGELYRHGYVYSAIILRRILVESNVSGSASKYYDYAASDMKAEIDYSKSVEWTTRVPSTEDFLKSLFTEHKRKNALWKIMQQKINGLSVDKGGITYSP